MAPLDREDLLWPLLEEPPSQQRYAEEPLVVCTCDLVLSITTHGSWPQVGGSP